MCGRYVLYATDEIYEHFATEGFGELKPNYNVAPTHEMPVFTNDGLSIMRWGLIPAWAKDEKMSYKLFNTRSESVFEKPMWKGIVKRNRCLIPANGFYEWEKTEEGKVPYYIHLPDKQLFSFAGIWETWKHEGKKRQTYSIMTTTPNKEMEPIHDRMPVIIDKNDYEMWLQADTQDDINALLQPLADGTLEMHEVSKDVNLVKNNSKVLIGPMNSK